MNISNAFDENNRPNILDQVATTNVRQRVPELPWVAVRNGEMPPMMFQLAFCDGRSVSYSYSDIREIHCQDAGIIQIYIHSIAKQVITIQGRLLRELAHLLSNAGIRSMREHDPRSAELPEDVPEIVSIHVELLGKQQSAGPDMGIVPF